MEEAQSLCDRVAVMDAGEIIALDSPTGLIAQHFETTAVECEARGDVALETLEGLPNFVFMFLSRIFFPVDMMPSWLRPVVDAIPLTYLADALRKLMVDAGSYYSLTRSVLILTAWLLVCGVLAVRFFKWEPQG